ncbi:DUF2634 domain-containing protein [Apilactobacillus micheneri]|uniref:DUF2634 domain-containing protein n=1 Tax=Apilactobacillus micheneri TaxID=1899430 RepID=UPI00112A0BCC|nr:DUF2634 domain-containing protein [Apilactobacillus micheneri]TPR40396.1 DUF2634 domain-containing protein [Apilactobacillus micheneri]
MKDIAMNNGQPVFEDGDYKYVYDADAVAQQVYITLQSKLNEFEPDQKLGLNQENLMGKNVVYDFVEQDIRDAIMEQVDQVKSVDSIEFDEDTDNRILSVNITFTTKDFGEINKNYSIANDG